MAVIGPTGSGKSTLAWLLLRMYDVEKGSLLLDGKPVNSYGADQIRTAISIVPQKPTLFSGTMRENLTWGCKNATEEEINKAIETADASFIYGLSKGLESEMEAGGANLSGGQKQRISIARAVLRHSPVIILDDATSALDALTEARVKGRLLDCKFRPTTIIITQRCSTAMSAERILVLENGNQMGFGPHENLLRTCSVYRSIWETQNGGINDKS